MQQKLLTGVDIGGTSIKIAFISLDGDIIYKWEIPTDRKNNGAQICPDIAKALVQKAEEQNIMYENILAIGVGAPGFVDVERGVVHEAVNIGWKNFDLKDRLETLTKLPVIADNDANLAALGEMWRGAGDGAKDVLCVTLGTGVGGGIIANGDILHGVSGTAGEIGHITVKPIDGAPCNCGKSGCLETIASATGIVRLTKELLLKGKVSSANLKVEQLTAKDVFVAAQEQDELALDVIKEVCFYLGLALANLGNSLNPKKIVMGGGVSRAGNTLLTPLQRSFNEYALGQVQQDTEIVLATLGNDAGVIGAAWIAKTKLL